VPSGEAVEMEKFERFVMLEIQRSQPVIGTYPPSAEVRAHLNGRRRSRR
jgi:hypothetical protein